MAKDKKDVKYELKIDITWNSISVKRLKKIMGDIAIKHKNACDVKISVRKVDTPPTSNCTWVTTDTHIGS